MGGVKDRDPPLAAEDVQQVEDLRPDGDVQHRDRLVGHQQFRLQHQRPGDDDPLPLPAGEFGREAIPEVIGGGQAARLQRGPYPFLLFFTGASQVVNFQRLGDDVENRLARVQRFVGVLEDHLRSLAQGHHAPATAQVRQAKP